MADVKAILVSVGKACLVLSKMVKIEHSVFALPFAYVGMFWAAQGWPGPRIFVLLTVAMMCIRSFAMAFNRLADMRIDAANPRTSNRPLVTGELTVSQTRIFLLLCAAGFLAACWGLNPLCFYLAPYALIWSACYSYAKRFTSLCHYALGSVHFLAPIAGWIAVSPMITPPAVLLGFGVLFWVAGFDILYSCQDAVFDSEHGLYSAPSRLGIPVSLALSTFSHVTTILFFALAGWVYGAGWMYFVSWAGISLILLVEHLLIREDDLRKITMAFFTLNGVVAIAFLIGVLADLFL